MRRLPKNQTSENQKSGKKGTPINKEDLCATAIEFANGQTLTEVEQTRRKDFALAWPVRLADVSVFWMAVAFQQPTLGSGPAPTRADRVSDSTPRIYYPPPIRRCRLVLRCCSCTAPALIVAQLRGHANRLRRRDA